MEKPDPTLPKIWIRIRCRVYLESEGELNLLIHFQLFDKIITLEIAFSPLIKEWKERCQIEFCEEILRQKFFLTF